MSRPDISRDPFLPGTVWLVGAGPGDPELLTLRAVRLIEAADILFHDALVGPGILDLIPAHVTTFSVGKRSGRHSRAQGDINQLLVQAAQAGQRVVRLKGGDPSIFGRSTEELETLREAGIAVSVCPGVTAASAAAASGLASLTLRGLARQLTFVTAHARAGEKLDLDWAGLAAADRTLAIYMGRAAAGEIGQSLIAAGRDPDTPVMIAVNVSLPQERVIRGKLSALAFLVRAISDDDPTLLLIGEAVGEAGSPAAASLALPALAERRAPVSR